MAGESALTPQTAPRTIEGLAAQSPFQLRLLIAKIDGLSTDEQKMAWHAMQTQEARAAYSLDVLREWDRKNPGAAAAASSPAPQAPAPAYSNGNGTAGAVGHFPSPPTVQQVAPVPSNVIAGPAQVNAAALAAAQAATAADTSKPRRQPRTSDATEAKPAELGAEVVTLLNSIFAALKAQGESQAAFEKRILGILEEAAGSKASRVTALERAVEDLQNRVQNNSQIQTWTLVAFLTFMQESMKAPIADILGAAISDSKNFQQLVAEAVGKA